MLFGIAIKACVIFGYLKRNLQISSPEVKSRAYQALVGPKHEYRSSIWGPYTQDDINKQEKFKRRAARWVQINLKNAISDGM
jgi:mitochondrial fission protein ELM1